MGAHETATEDKGDSSWAYLSSSVYHQHLSESQKSRNLPRSTSGSQYLALERRNGPNPSERSIGMPISAHKTATEDKCDSSWAYLSSYLYHQPLIETQKSRNLPGTIPGNQNLALGRRNGPNPSERSLGESIMVNIMDTEDKGDSSWAYLSSYLYHQPCTESQKCQNRPGTTLGSYDRRLCAITTIPNLG